MKADIKIWILTGDKQETAINIGEWEQRDYSGAWCFFPNVCYKNTLFQSQQTIKIFAT